MSPIVSVVMSVFNDEKHLEMSILSLLNQTYADFELIIVNDGSSDGSAYMLDKFAQQDQRICVLHRQNQGLTKSLIEGCALAKGEMIARQDGDDYSLPTRLEKQLELLSMDPKIGFVSCATDYIDENGELLDHIVLETDPIKATEALLMERKGPPAHGSVMFRRTIYESVGGYRSCFYYGQDSDLWLRMARMSRLGFCPETLYCWRVCPNGISSRTSDLQSQFGNLGQSAHQARLRGEDETNYLVAAEELTSLIRFKNLHMKHDARLQAAAHYRIGTCLWKLKNKAARAHFSEAIRLDPWNWKARVRLLSTYFGKPTKRHEK